MRQFFLVFFLPAALSWNPIPNPFKAFSLTQSHPAVAISQPVPDQVPAPNIRQAQTRQSTSNYFGKKILNFDDTSGQLVSSYGDSSSLGDDFLSKEVSGFFGNKIHNGFISNVSSATSFPPQGVSPL